MHGVKKLSIFEYSKTEFSSQSDVIMEKGKWEIGYSGIQYGYAASIGEVTVLDDCMQSTITYSVLISPCFALHPYEKH